MSADLNPSSVDFKIPESLVKSMEERKRKGKDVVKESLPEESYKDVYAR